MPPCRDMLVDFRQARCRRGHANPLRKVKSRPRIPRINNKYLGEVPNQLCFFEPQNDVSGLDLCASHRLAGFLATIVDCPKTET